jgi:HPt (histidine-containing phosphotransfer) domain-containing protein
VDGTTEILDLAALRRNFADDMGFVGRLLAKFETRYPNQLQAVRDALSRGDGAAAGDAAHRVAGEASVFYATAARQAALRVEDLARAGRLAEAAGACDVLGAELDRLKSALRGLADG